MAGTNTLRAGIAALVFLAALVALAAVEGVAVAGPRGGSGSSRALVVIDDGVTRTEACVFFPGTIDGIEALERTGTETVLTGFGGMGSAVCALNGVGCSASSCLTCQAPKFWHYLRADEGSSSFTTSPLGAGASKVENGDIELWMWGGSITPPEVPSVDEACGPLVTTTTITVRPSPTTTAAPRPGGGGASPTTPAPVDPPGSATPAPGPFLTPTTTVPNAPSTSAPEVAASTPTAGETPPSTARGDAGDEATPSDESKEGSARGLAPTPDPIPPQDESAAPGQGDGEVAAGPAVGGAASAPGGGWLGVATVLVLVGGLATWATILRRRSRA